jgi:hypothetical protein
MATTNTTVEMGGIFKQVYGDAVQRAYPNGVRLIKDIKFDKANQIGAAYNIPVVLTHENGFTLKASGSTDAFDILDPAVGVSKNATVDAAQIVLSSELNYEAAAKAASAGKRAFVKATSHVVRNMTDSHKKMLEVQALYGQQDIGVVGTDSGSGVYKISAATWAPGIWAGLENGRLDALKSDLTTPEATNGPFPNAAVTSVDMTARTVTFASDSTDVVAGYRFFFENACAPSATPTFNENLGIHKALTTSGSVFGISNSTYNLWKPASTNAGGQLQFDHIQETAARIAEKGGINGKLKCYVSNLTWIDLLGDQAALRRYDGGEGKSGAYVSGAEEIVFHTATGPVSIVPSIYVKRGFAYMLDTGCWSRIGSWDFGFGDPISGEIFHRLESKAGVDLRSYSAVSVFCRSLGRNGIITGIVNSAS